jgi:outer membrane protein assembly factor BamB
MISIFPVRPLAVIGGLLFACSVNGQSLDEIVRTSGVTGGFVVQVGSDDGQRLAALAANPRYTIHGLELDDQAVDQSRQSLLDAGLYGRVAVDRWNGRRLPYADGMVNLLIDDGASPEGEVRRVLAPLGVHLRKTADGWQKTVQPWPADIDQWTHYLHDPGNNAVAKDTRVGPPRSLQWQAGPNWARHHDRLASLSALVTAAGRVFFIQDEGPTESILLPADWQLVARDAFNGTELWRQPIPEWQTSLWPLKSGPAQLPRRLVATSDAVFATLGIDVPVTALDAATGEIRRVYEATLGAEELIVDDGILVVVADQQVDREKYLEFRRVNQPWWQGKTIRIVAVRIDTGQVLWDHASPVVPLTLAVQDDSVVFHNGHCVVALDRQTGQQRWQSEPPPIVPTLYSFFAPTLVAKDGVVLFAGGEEAGLVKSGGGPVKPDTLTALDAASGKVLWTASHSASGYSSPQDVFVIDGTVWFAGVANSRLPGDVTGLDLRTGSVRTHHEKADVDTYWFHHRCYRGKATTNYLLTSRTGIEFIDHASGNWDINHWVRGGCLYGVMPANGLLYVPPHACACFPESKLFGFNALGAGNGQPGAASEPRHERGPAFGAVDSSTAPAPWPTYRGNPARSGSTPQTLPDQVSEIWQHDLGGKLSAVTVADDTVFVARIDHHTVHAIDAGTGQPRWQRTVGGRVDSPPTIHQGMAIFGSADGWIYSLRVSDGELVWRFRAAPDDTRILVHGQLESRWPVPGSVLVLDQTVYATAGRSMFLDGGIRLVRLDAATGQLLGEEVFDHRHPDTGENLQANTQRLTLPVALPDVLASDGQHLYMRSQKMDLAGKRRMPDLSSTDRVGQLAAEQGGDGQHLFASAGFLDDEWFHRAYWVYGRRFEGGWNAYYLAGRNVPAGKILSFDEDRVYGFGRQPKYFQWTTPMNYHLFAAPRGFEALEARRSKREVGSIIRVEGSASLNPANQPVTVSAWVRPLGPDGVIVAHGGGVLGYALYLRQNVPHFAVAVKSQRSGTDAAAKLDRDWHHLAGVLAADGTLRLYVDGTLAAAGKASGLIPAQPADALEVGADERSLVGPYSAREVPFRGDIDDLRIYRGELPETAIAALADGQTEITAGKAQLVLHYPFDDGKATDASGRNNHGNLAGTEVVPGRLGNALRFSGILPGDPDASHVPFLWSADSPVLVRGLVASPDKLFVAGPPDLLDEQQAFSNLDDPATREAIAAQDAARLGAHGGLLQAVSTQDGTKLQTLTLPTIPVWDGLAAGQGRLLLAGIDGTLRCFGPAD